MIILLENISKSFGKQIVLDELNLTIESKKITVIIGQSGGATCVAISHDIDSTFKIAHKVAMLYKGKIIAEDDAIEDLKKTLASLGDITGTINRGEYLIEDEALKSYLPLRIQPREDKYYLIQIVDENQTFFLGAGLNFSDDDIKTFIGSIPLPKFLASLVNLGNVTMGKSLKTGNHFNSNLNFGISITTWRMHAK